MLYSLLGSILTSWEAIPRGSWRAGSVWRCPLPFSRSFTPVGYPVLFFFCRITFVGLVSIFLFVGLDLLPLILWPWGIALRSLDRQFFKK